MELWVNELWLLFTAVIFTAYGWYMGVKNKVQTVSEAVIDTLIEQEYLKTRGHGENMEILKHTEWNND
jgi:lipopolysaccharide biosynthesis regulator YciM